MSDASPDVEGIETMCRHAYQFRKRSDASPDVEGIETSLVKPSACNSPSQMHRPMLRALKRQNPRHLPTPTLESDASPDVEGIETQEWKLSRSKRPSQMHRPMLRALKHRTINRWTLLNVVRCIARC